MWDWWQLARDIPRSVCRVSELPKDLIPFHLVTPTGRWHQQADLTEEAEREWRPQVRRLLARHRDCKVVVVDIHE